MCRKVLHVSCCKYVGPVPPCTVSSFCGAFWHQSTEWQYHITAECFERCPLQSHQPSETHLWTQLLTKQPERCMNVAHTHTHTYRSRPAQAHTVTENISPDSDSTEWHFTITLGLRGARKLSVWEWKAACLTCSQKRSKWSCQNRPGSEPDYHTFSVLLGDVKRTTTECPFKAMQTIWQKNPS